MRLSIVLSVLFVMLLCSSSVPYELTDEQKVVGLTKELMIDHHNLKKVYLNKAKRLIAYKRDDTFTKSVNEFLEDKLELKNCLWKGRDEYNTSKSRQWNFNGYWDNDNIIPIGEKKYQEIIDRNRKKSSEGILTYKYSLNNTIFTYTDLFRFNCKDKDLYYIELKKKYGVREEYYAYVFMVYGNRVKVIMNFQDSKII